MEDIRLNPQARMAQKSVKDRVKEQAQRQRHVAKRTIEMQQKKKEAEARKARYLQETGGMQYTAVAMANRKWLWVKFTSFSTIEMFIFEIIIK